MSPERTDRARHALAAPESVVADHVGDRPAAEVPGDDPEDRSSEADLVQLAPRRWSRRRIIAAGGVTAVLLIGGGAVLTRDSGAEGGGQSGDKADAAAATDVTSAAVERRDLEERAELDGTLGYGEVTDVVLAGQGTITRLAPIGAVVDRSQTLLEVDGRPVPLLFGDRPLWRPLGPGVTDGADVEQLEANMVALGIVTGSELTVDQDWTYATTAAVEEWQESLGLDDTGTVAPGQVVFLPGAVRVAEHPTPVGGAAAGTVLGVTGTSRQVTIDLEATRQGLLKEDQAVGVVLPEGTETAGTVTSVGNVATSGDSGTGGGAQGEGGGDSEATIEVVIALDDPSAGGTLDHAPVTVRVVTSAATDVLAVPVDALLALAEGGYAVEVVQDDGSTRTIAVELGAFASGWVQVTGEVAVGDEVVVPRD